MFRWRILQGLPQYGYDTEGRELLLIHLFFHQKVHSVTPEQAQKHVTDQLEQLTDKKLLVVEADSLPSHATLRMAGLNESVHVLRYRSNLSQHLPYLAVSQCGFMLRVLESAEPLRFDVMSKPSLPTELLRLARRRFEQNGERIAENGLAELCKIFQSALGVQLRSIPVSIRVDDWILSEFPALEQMQRTCVIQQLTEGIATLAPGVRKNIPNEIFEPSAGMNAALAAYWARTFGDENLALAYKATGFSSVAATLLGHLDTISSHPDNDRQLVQTWLETLGLQDWYGVEQKQQI